MATAAKKKASSAESADDAFRTTLKRLDLEDAREALLCLPGTYADCRTPNTEIPYDDDEDRRLYRLRVTGKVTGFNDSGKPLPLENPKVWYYVRRLEVILEDREGTKVTFNHFGSAYALKDVINGQVPEMFIVGLIKHFGNKGAFICKTEEPPAHAVGRIWVKYAGIPGRVAGEKVEAMVRAQLDNPAAYRHCAAKLTGALGMNADEALEAAGVGDRFKTFEELLQALHQPKRIEDGWFARAAAHKLSAMSVQASALRHNLRHPHAQSPIGLDVGDLDRLAATQKEKLTEEQSGVALAIAELLRQPRPANALLSGDVGTGKTLTFLLPAVLAHQAGAKVAIIAPTSILADQIALQVVNRFGAEVRGVERIEAGGKIQDHGNILVGTPGLVSVAGKAKYTPNLLICDEQHKLSTEIREKLLKPWTHVLEVSATPVPRSLASALFGGKVILNLRRCPVDKTFHNFIGDVPTHRRRFTAMLRWALDNGKRAAVIYPRVAPPKAKPVEDQAGEQQALEMVELKPEEEKQSVETGAAALEQAFPGKVVAIHGGMHPDDIKRAIESVRSGEKPLVVASTVIETGVDIPSVAAMIVRDADCFGISQLHQLRGRLVRNGGEGYFAMLVQDLSALQPDTLQRLQAIERSTDGYELAEMDLTIRGFGDVEGTAQSGSTSAVFRLLQLRPEDFLRKKLSVMDVMPKQARMFEDDEPAESDSRAGQPRLFA